MAFSFIIKWIFDIKNESIKLEKDFLISKKSCLDIRKLIYYNKKKFLFLNIRYSFSIIKKSISNIKVSFSNIKNIYQY